MDFEYIKPKIKDLKENFINLLKYTPAEIYILGALGLMLGVGGQHHYENYRTKRIPLGFSEITQIQRDAQSLGEELSSRTIYLASTNDQYMKVFECMNYANLKTFTGKNTHMFAQELEMRLDPTFKFHTHNLQDFLNSVPRDADKFLLSFQDHINLMNKISPITNLFQRTWDYDSTDITHTEEECSTDSEGNEHCDDVEVYDYTDHDFTYYKQYGEQASKAIDQLTVEFVDLKYDEQVRLASKTNAEGEMAAEVSRQKIGEHKKLSRVELLTIANTWHYGSTLTQNLGKINSLWRNYNQDAFEWRIAKNTAKSESYSTTSRSDSGPKEYQLVERTIDTGNALKSAIYEVYDGVMYTKSQTKVLEAKIKEFISVELDHKPGDSDKLKSEIMDICITGYKKNFKGGLDVDLYRWWMLPISGVAGMLLLGSLGFGIDELTKRNRFYDKFQ